VLILSVNFGALGALGSADLVAALSGPGTHVDGAAVRTD